MIDFLVVMNTTIPIMLKVGEWICIFKSIILGEEVRRRACIEYYYFQFTVEITEMHKIMILYFYTGVKLSLI